MSFKLDYEIEKNPPAEWVRYLKPYCGIYLPRADDVATVAAPFVNGPIGEPGMLLVDYKSDISPWRVTDNGLGFDGKPVIQPIVGQLSATLAVRVDRLDQVVDTMYFLLARLRRLEILFEAECAASKAVFGAGELKIKPVGFISSTSEIGQMIQDMIGSLDSLEEGQNDNVDDSSETGIPGFEQPPGWSNKFKNN